MVNTGTISSPSVASTQFFWYIAMSATISVMTLDRMLVKVLVMVFFTPSMSLVILVMISPWLLEVKKRWLMLCRCLNIALRMSKVMCCAIQLLR